MLSNGIRISWPIHNSALEPTVLGRKARPLNRKMGKNDTVDEAAPSAATRDEMRSYLDAWHIGDESGQRTALNKVIQTWRADNAAGGVPVHGHLPFPGDFAKVVVGLLAEAANVRCRSHHYATRTER
jgi:hypothetical protein